MPEGVQMPNIFHKNGKNNLHFQMDIFAISIFNIIEKVSSAKAEKIEGSNSIYYSKLQWCPLSACLTPIIKRKKNILLTFFMPIYSARRNNDVVYVNAFYNW